jgi:hypothetical protein
VASSLSILLGWVCKSGSYIRTLDKPKLGKSRIRYLRDKLAYDQVGTASARFQKDTSKIGKYPADHLDSIFRYEMAWQEFFKVETTIAEAQAEKLGRPIRRVQGDLLITCNDFARPIQYDRHDGDKYSVSQLRLEANTRAEAKSTNLMCMTMLEGSLDDRSKTVIQNTANPSGSTTELQMVAIAHDYPFIVYLIQYEVQTGFYSWILGMDRPGNEFEFHPFRRPLYHTAEAELDAELWSKLKEGAVAAMEQHCNEIIEEESQRRAAAEAQRQRQAEEEMQRQAEEEVQRQAEAEAHAERLIREDKFNQLVAQRRGKRLDHRIKGSKVYQNLAEHHKRQGKTSPFTLIKDKPRVYAYGHD